MITADTITDEQILALRDSIAPFSTPRTLVEHTADERDVINACDYALTPYIELAAKRSGARARCVEILNARESQARREPGFGCCEVKP